MLFLASHKDITKEKSVVHEETELESTVVGKSHSYFVMFCMYFRVIHKHVYSAIFEKYLIFDFH